MNQIDFILGEKSSRKKMDKIYSTYYKDEMVKTRSQAKTSPEKPKPKIKKSTTEIMRNNRKSEDYKLKEGYNKLLKRIAKGHVPQGNSLTKYQTFGLTESTINKIREENGYEKIKVNIPQVANVVPTNVIQQEINENYRKEQAKIDKQKSIQIREDAEALRKAQEKAIKDNEGKIVVVDKDEIHSIENITAWFFRNKGTADFKTGRPRSAETLRRMFNFWIGGNKNGKYKEPEMWKGSGGQFYNLFNRWRPDVCDGDITHCLKDVDDLIQFVLNYKDISQSTKEQWLECLIVVVREYPAFGIERFRDTYNKLESAIKQIKSKVDSQRIKRRAEERITSFDEIKELIEKEFGKDSKEFLYISMYNELPSRDDMNNLMITYQSIDSDTRKNIENINNGDNVLFIPIDESKPVEFALIRFKTQSNFGKIYHRFTMKVSKMIRDYLENMTASKLLKLKGTLFGLEKMSKFVGDMLIKIGVKKKKGDPNYKANENIGNITLLRKAYVTREMAKIKDETDREKISFLLKHSPSASVTYVRTLLPKYEQLKAELDGVKYDENE